MNSLLMTRAAQHEALFAGSKRSRPFHGWRPRFGSVIVAGAVIAMFLLLASRVGAATADLACGQEPGNRFFWVERAFCDLEVNLPETAQGIILWNHGLWSTTEAWRAPAPPAFRLLQVHGWEVLVVKRHNLAEANGSDWTLSRAVERTLEEAKRQHAAGYGKIVFGGQSFGGYITLEAAQQMPDLFAAIAMAPGVMSIATRRWDPSVTDRSLQRVKIDRIALVFPKDDALFGSIDRGTFEPGGVAGIHSHRERPAFAYILEGTLTELREGGYLRQYKPGDAITESRDVVHWAENPTGRKVTLVGVDIIKP